MPSRRTFNHDKCVDRFKSGETIEDLAGYFQKTTGGIYSALRRTMSLHVVHNTWKKTQEAERQYLEQMRSDEETSLREQEERAAALGIVPTPRPAQTVNTDALVKLVPYVRRRACVALAYLDRNPEVAREEIQGLLTAMDEAEKSK